eukprot:1442535-Amphidinium_carterae.1
MQRQSSRHSANESGAHESMARTLTYSHTLIRSYAHTLIRSYSHSQARTNSLSLPIAVGYY